MTSDQVHPVRGADTSPAELLDQVVQLPPAVRNESVESVHALVSMAFSRLSEASIGRVGQAAAGRPRLERLRIEIGRLIGRLDDDLAEGVRSVLRSPDVRRLESAWRGLHYLWTFPDDPTGTEREIHLLELTWDELADDLDQPVDIEASCLFRQLYDERLDMPNGKPFGLLMVDFEFGLGCKDGSPMRDIEVLRVLSTIGERSFCPVVANAAPTLVLRDRWSDLSSDALSRVLEDRRLIDYRALRETSAARFVVLAAPRILARPEWTGERVRGLDFRFDEREDDCGGVAGERGECGPLWCGAAFAFAATALQAFDRTGWFADLRGADVSDGRFEHRGGVIPAPSVGRFDAAIPPNRRTLPADLRYFDESCRSSVECVFEESVEHELQAIGLLPISRCRFTDSLALYGIRSLHRPPSHDHDPTARANARIGALIPHTLCACRVAHAVGRIFRDLIGSGVGPEKIQQGLESWLSKLVDSSDEIDPRRLGETPLRDRSVMVRSCGPGAYECEIRIEPRIQFETLRGSVVLPPVRFGTS